MLYKEKDTVYTIWDGCSLEKFMVNSDLVDFNWETSLSSCDVLSHYDMYYNEEKSTFVIKDDEKTTIVKKCSEDAEDMEKAMLYAFLKHIGITPKMINEQLKKVHIYKKKDDKHEKD